MIKLKELLDINYPSVDLFSESPARATAWNDELLGSLGGNYTFTIGLKEKGKQIGTFENYIIYQYPYVKDVFDCFVKDDYTLAYVQYRIINDVCNLFKVWQDPTSIGLIRKIVLGYYLKKYDTLLTGNIHTELGKNCIDKLLNQAKELGYKIFVLKNNNEKVYVDDLSKLNTYYSSGTTGLQYQFGIEK